MTFGRVRPALLIFVNVPMAISGGVAALALRGLPLSVSAAIGFIALFGVAVLNGLVLVTSIERLRDAGATAADAVLRGADARLRPVLTTALVASLGLPPDGARDRRRRRGAAAARDVSSAASSRRRC